MSKYSPVTVPAQRPVPSLHMTDSPLFFSRHARYSTKGPLGGYPHFAAISNTLGHTPRSKNKVRSRKRKRKRRRKKKNLSYFPKTSAKQGLEYQCNVTTVMTRNYNNKSSFMSIRKHYVAHEETIGTLPHFPLFFQTKKKREKCQNAQTVSDLLMQQIINGQLLVNAYIGDDRHCGSPSAGYAFL